jgi:glutamate synthase (NADPH) small chain
MIKVKFSSEVLEKAQRIVNDCINCKKCMNECVMMNDFGSSPKTILRVLTLEGQMEPLLAYSCNGCDNCTIVCPKELEMKHVFLGSRKDFVLANGGTSPIKGHKAVKMHQLFSFSKLFSIKKQEGRK